MTWPLFGIKRKDTTPEGLLTTLPIFSPCWAKKNAKGLALSNNVVKGCMCSCFTFQSSITSVNHISLQPYKIQIISHKVGFAWGFTRPTAKKNPYANHISWDIISIFHGHGPSYLYLRCCLTPTILIWNKQVVSFNLSSTDNVKLVSYCAELKYSILHSNRCF